MKHKEGMGSIPIKETYRWLIRVLGYFKIPIEGCMFLLDTPVSSCVKNEPQWTKEEEVCPKGSELWHLLSVYNPCKNIPIF